MTNFAENNRLVVLTEGCFPVRFLTFELNHASSPVHLCAFSRTWVPLLHPIVHGMLSRCTNSVTADVICKMWPNHLFAK